MFNRDQIKQIEKGIIAGVDVSIYAKPEFGWLQMEQIRFGLEGGIEVSIYAKPEFDWRQMWQIREGLEEKNNV